MLKSLLPLLFIGVALVGFGVDGHDAHAAQTKKRPHASSSIPAPDRVTAPARAGDLNSPSTDFSTVSPVIDDPRPDMIRPKHKKDPTFD